MPTSFDEGDEILARVAPNWREHLWTDGKIIDHIVEQIAFNRRLLRKPSAARQLRRKAARVEYMRKLMKRLRAEGRA